MCVLSPPSPSLSPSLSLYSRRPPRERARAHIVSIRCAHNAQPGKRERQSQRSGSLSLSLSFSFSITGFCWHPRMAAVCWSLLIHSYTFVHSYKTRRIWRIGRIYDLSIAFFLVGRRIYAIYIYAIYRQGKTQYYCVDYIPHVVYV